MDALEAFGTMTNDTASCTQWVAGVLAIAEVTVADMERVVTRERLHRWYGDGMSALIAASSLRSWVRTALVGERADAEAAALRRMLTTVDPCCASGCSKPAKTLGAPFCTDHMNDEALIKAWEEL